jgi:hypothetical protein
MGRPNVVIAEPEVEPTQATNKSQQVAAANCCKSGTTHQLYNAPWCKATSGLQSMLGDAANVQGSTMQHAIARCECNAVPRSRLRPYCQGAQLENAAAFWHRRCYVNDNARTVCEPNQSSCTQQQVV